VDAGGDRRHLGEMGRELSLAELLGVDVGPLDDRLLLRDAALSAQSRHRRAFVVGGERYADLLDPSNGWPSDRIVAAAALAPDAMTADVLATVIGVGRGAAGVRLAGRQLGRSRAAVRELAPCGPHHRRPGRHSDLTRSSSGTQATRRHPTGDASEGTPPLGRRPGS